MRGGLKATGEPELSDYHLRSAWRSSTLEEDGVYPYLSGYYYQEESGVGYIALLNTTTQIKAQ